MNRAAIHPPEELAPGAPASGAPSGAAVVGGPSAELGKLEVPRGWSDLARSDWVSYRRHMLDYCLRWSAPLMRGVVVDLGGKRERKRGGFRPPDNARCIYVNLDRSTWPDVLADVGRVPLADGCADCVICTEVLEHLAEPGTCVAEAHRLLRVDGVLIASVPFLFPVHADPWDFQRFTADGLIRLCRSFESVTVLPMGGWLGTLGLMLEMRSWELGGSWPWRGARRRSLRAASRVLQYLDLRAGASGGTPALPAFTSGYFIVARR